jgi:hypothetical protein
LIGRIHKLLNQERRVLVVILAEQNDHHCARATLVVRNAELLHFVEEIDRFLHFT